MLTLMVAAVALKARQQPSKYRQILRNSGDVQYFADFNIGGQDIAGIFDTGSFEIVVRSSRCMACMNPTAAYDHKKSKSYEEDGKLTMHNYGSGPCETMLGYDTVKVGSELVAERQPIWEITRHNIPVLNRAKFAAIVGIGPKFGYKSTRKTLLMNYHVDEFSICLGKEAGSDGFLTWGPDGSSLAEEDVRTAKVYGKHHWATKMSKVSVKVGKDEPKLDDVCPNGCAAIIDSGTSLIAAPRSALIALSAQLGQIKDDCSNFHELPHLLFSLDGQDFELPPRAYVMRMRGAELKANDIWDLLFFKPKVRTHEVCMPAFMEMNMRTQMGDMWILGMPFFREFHTTFDRQKQVMRFAKAGPECQPVPMPVLETQEEAKEVLENEKAESATEEKAKAATEEKEENSVALSASKQDTPLTVNVDDLIAPRFSLQYEVNQTDDFEV